MRAWFVQRVKCAPTKDRSMELLAILAPQLAVHTSTSSYWIEQTKIKSFIEKLLGNFLPMIACENCKQFLLTTITAPNSARWCDAGWKLLQIYLLEPCVVSPPLRLSWETFSDTILMQQFIPQHSSFRYIHYKCFWDGIYQKEEIEKN